MPLKPWYKLATPRADLRDGKPLDAAEFAVHLDQIRDERAPAVYQRPEEFFDRTYLTKSLLDLSSQVVRRLSGDSTGSSAVFNLSTQFGGGKTHALTLLYHLAKGGARAAGWTGVDKILQASGQASVPEAAIAVFVGTEFDAIAGRGGGDGTPMRRTPWGEIAFQLGGMEAWKVVEEHDRLLTAPAGDVIRRLLPKNRPILILMDELLNFSSRSRKSGLSAQLYSFLQNLSEETRGHDRMVLAVSIPASELEMNVEDQADYERIKKLLDRLGKAVMMAAEGETAEIIRRRLFEWDQRGTSVDGKVMLGPEAHETCERYAEWVREYRQQLPGWFSSDTALSAFLASYPFHPVVLSVFERKWQSLPRFQQTRGVLRLLALWVARAYQDGFKGAHRDPLIGLGTAPLDDPQFRAAVFEQLGEGKLEGAVTTDIAGRREAHAIRLDDEAVDAIKAARLHRKAATAIFFESNGGQARGEASIPEIRLAIGEPGLDIGHVETVAEELVGDCYYLTLERSKYRFSIAPNLNKILTDRRANIPPARVEERVRDEIRKVFSAGKVERVFFPAKSGEIPDRPALTFVVLPPEQSAQDRASTESAIAVMNREYGSSGRTFKSALVWCVSDAPGSLRDEAKKVLAWEEIREEESDRFDESQKRQMAESLKKAERDLREAVWRSYKYVFVLGKDNELKAIDLGLVHSSAAESLVALVLNRLRQDGEVATDISPTFLVRNWPPAVPEWNTKSVRDYFFASPRFPRLLVSDAIKATISRGIQDGHFAYGGKSGGGKYEPFLYKTTVPERDVEISDGVVLIPKAEAEAYRARVERSAGSGGGADGQGAGTSVPGSVCGTQGGSPGSTSSSGTTAPGPGGATPGDPGLFPGTGTADRTCDGTTPPLSAAAKSFRWVGSVPAQKWMNFYTKVLTQFAVGSSMSLRVTVEVRPPAGVTPQQVEETRSALRELGLGDHVDVD
jgi:hypothetical protein